MHPPLGALTTQTSATCADCVYDSPTASDRESTRLPLVSSELRSRRPPVSFDTTTGTLAPGARGLSACSLAHEASAGDAADAGVDGALAVAVAPGSAVAAVVAVGTGVGADVAVPVGAPGAPVAAAERDGEAVAASGCVVMGAPVARTVSGPHAVRRKISTVIVARRIPDTVRCATAYSREC
jgi:hypothetical protein